MAVAAVANRYDIFAGGIGCPGNNCARVEVFAVVLDKWFTPKAQAQLYNAATILDGSGRQ